MKRQQDPRFNKKRMMKEKTSESNEQRRRRVVGEEIGTATKKIRVERVDTTNTILNM